MTNSRREKEAWVALSHAMASRDDPMSALEVQQLGWLNEMLVREEQYTLEIYRRAVASQDTEQLLAHGRSFSDLTARSWLWVLGAFEVFRRAKNRNGGLAKAPEFVALHREIWPIRSVLAKRAVLESGSAKQIPDYLVGSDGSVGWRYIGWDGQRTSFFRAHFAAAWRSRAQTLRLAAGLPA